MPRSKSMRADELIRQLESDPKHVARQREWERRSAQSLRECAADEAKLVAQLRSAGFDIAPFRSISPVEARPLPQCRSLLRILISRTIRASGKLLFAPFPFATLMMLLCHD